jgi:hypothetical protein
MSALNKRIAALIVIGIVVVSCGDGSHGTGVPGASGTTDTATGPVRSTSSFAELARGVEAGADNECTRGEPACIDAILTEMRSRLARLVDTCDYLAPWALTYVKTTEGFRTLVATPGALDDPVFFTELDVRFAKLYFTAYDEWYGGRKSEVPEAWRIAFDAADRKAVSALGDMMLGISAHISRDLPVALVNTGLPPDGSRQLGDFRAVNKVIEAVMSPVITEVGARFDPTVTAANVPGIAADEKAVIAVVGGWRETSFIDGERLSAAGSDRASVESQIDAVTANENLLIRAATSYVPFVSGSEQRDDFCRQHGQG